MKTNASDLESRSTAETSSEDGSLMSFYDQFGTKTSGVEAKGPKYTYDTDIGGNITDYNTC